MTIELLQTKAVTRVLIPMKTEELLTICLESPTLVRLLEAEQISAELRSAKSVGLLIKLEVV